MSGSAARSWSRELIPSFVKTFLRCHSTVRLLRKRAPPISRFERPSRASRGADLVEPAVGQLELRFNADSPHDAPTLEPIREMVEQRALADAGLAAKHQDPAFAVENISQSLLERAALRVASKKSRRSLRVYGHLSGPLDDELASSLMPEPECHRRPLARRRRPEPRLPGR